MRLLSTLALITTLISAPVAAVVVATPAYAGCTRTEQVGCFELDLVNLAYNPNSALMQEMVEHGNVDGDINPDYGPRLYNYYKNGSGQSAGNKSFYVYTWNANCSASSMSEYHIVGRNGANPKRRNVTEISTSNGPAGATGYEIGPPHQAFLVQTDKAVAAIQFPWDCIGSNSYILVCTGDNRTIYPDRVTDIKGIWLRPSQLASYRNKGWEYILLPHISL